MKSMKKRILKAQKLNDSNERRAVMLGFKNNAEYQTTIKKTKLRFNI